MTRLASYTGHNTRHGVQLLAAASLTVQAPVLQKNAILKENTYNLHATCLNMIYIV
jgi:hypothetical protein